MARWLDRRSPDDRILGPAGCRRDCAMSLSWKDFQGVNAGLAEELYERFLADPNSVDEATRDFFRREDPPGPQPSSRNEPRNPGTPEPRNLAKAMGAVNLAQSIRRYGHLAARIDPLGSRPVGDPALEPATHGVSDADLKTLPGDLIVGHVADANATMADVIAKLRDMYCGTTGYDFAHIFVPEE